MMIRIVVLSVVGAVAVISFLISLFVDDQLRSTLITVASVAAGICAVIGVGFAFTGGSK